MDLISVIFNNNTLNFFRFFLCSLKKSIIIIGIIVIAITGIIFGLIVYSYDQIDVSFVDIYSVEIEFETLSLSNLVTLGIDFLSGNWMEAALDLIAGFKLGLIFELNNNGLFPVYIPEISYSLSINNIPIGEGHSEINTTINPGESTEVTVLQSFQKDSFWSPRESILKSKGEIEIGISGIAYFELLGQRIPIPFESKKQVSLLDEIQNQLDKQILN